MKRFSLNLFVILTIFIFGISSISARSIKNLNPANGLIKDILINFKDAQEKLLSLADAIPEKDYSWRPSEGIRSVSETIVHVAVANFFIPQYLGIKSTEKVSFDMEKTVTKKADVIALLKKSFVHDNDVISKVDVKALHDKVDFFNNHKSSKIGIILTIVTHNHEHLGQLIAYARSVGVVPPWSQKEK
ncbi:MAG: DinB family protein [Ignavibacteriales bacterium CG_4_9_14_3_um_filter_30_11]|nr:MAG: DinB family protein [Ignavibacteriales bacterium CG_4_9_14_3_um_filter_30_11]